MWEVNSSVDFTICKSPIRGKKYCIAPGAGNKSDVLTYEIAPHIAGNLLRFIEGRPGLMPRYSPGAEGCMRGFPLTSAYWESIPPISWPTLQYHASRGAKDFTNAKGHARKKPLRSQGNSHWTRMGKWCALALARLHPRFRGEGWWWWGRGFLSLFFGPRL